MPISFGGKYYEDYLDMELDNIKQNAGFFSSLFGSDEPTVTETKAPPLSQFPTGPDVEAAKKYGYYDNIYEPYSKGDIVRILGTEVDRKDPKTKRTLKEFATLAGVDIGEDLVFDPRASKIVESNPELGSVLARGYMASNRIPVAAVGWDPERIIMDVKSGKNVTVAGLYDSPELAGTKTDLIYANKDFVSTPVHESIHRGISILRRKNPEFFESNPLPSEEMIVRYLMATQAGNPEAGRGDIGDHQISTAKYMFEDSKTADIYAKSLEKLTRLAEDELGTRSRRRGPD